jgi:lipopolysaccharide/colanic/teichoic acid biosynthesis glycosyltransferase
VYRPRKRYLLTKRVIDIAAVLAVAPLLVPAAALIALAIRIDSPGPVVFSQMRTGQHGRRFRMYKFRTMVTNAEELKAELAHLNELQWPDFKITDDPRVTRVGKFLRVTSLDELPQLYNVFRGDMSLVGPRPTSFAADTYDLWHTVRLEVRPGLTGLWQVRARHTSEFDDRLRLDVEYVRTMSIATDLSILLQTVGSVLHRSGA